jgi:hypothetical protein
MYSFQQLCETEKGFYEQKSKMKNSSIMVILSLGRMNHQSIEHVFQSWEVEMSFSVKFDSMFYPFSLYNKASYR